MNELQRVMDSTELSRKTICQNAEKSSWIYKVLFIIPNLILNNNTFILLKIFFKYILYNII